MGITAEVPGGAAEAGGPQPSQGPAQFHLITTGPLAQARP